MARSKTATKNVSKSNPTVIQNQAVVPVNNMNAVAEQVVSAITKAINNPKLDVKKMQAIMDMQFQAMRFHAEIAYNRAMNACQAEIPPITPNKWNEHTKSWYADLDAIDTVIRPLYGAHGFSLSFDTNHLDEKRIESVCWVRHTDGHKERHTLAGEIDDTGAKGTRNKTGIQGTGSSVTYLRRFQTAQIFNVIIEGIDKDGNTTSPPKRSEGETFNQRMRQESQTIDGEVLPPVDTETLKKEIKGIRLKKDRIAHVNSNLHIIQELAKAGNEALIAEIHALADKGE